MTDDPIISPKYYKFMSKEKALEAIERNPDGIEVIDVIEACDLDYSLGQVTKYLLRAGKKDPSTKITDLGKAKYYLDRYIRQHASKQLPEIRIDLGGAE